MDSMDIKKRMKENLHYLPFVLLGIALLYLHFHIEVDYGDDVAFREVALASDFNLVSWLIKRYRTWSSRTFIDMLMMFMVALPQIVWQVLDALLMTAASVFISKICCTEDCRAQKNWVVACLSFTIDVAILKEAGWIATSLNYIWPIAFGIISLYPIRKICSGRQPKAYEYLIYSVCLLIGASSEQFCIVLLAIYGTGNLIWYREHKKIEPYLSLQLVLCVLSLTYILACPGNALRTVAETEHWFPAYASFGVLKKAELGISYTLKTIFLQDNIWFLIFLVLLAAGIWLKYDRWIYKAAGIAPAASLVLLRHAHKGRGDGMLPFNMMNEVGVFRADTLGSFKVFIIYTGLLYLCCVILIDIYILFGDSLAALSLGGTFLLGLMTRAMMGFSPTIWMSGGRTAICLMYALLCCSVLIVDTWDFHDKKMADILYLFVIFAAIGGFVDNYNYIFIIG